MILCEKEIPVIFYNSLPLLLDWTYCRLEGLIQNFTIAEMEVNSYYISYVLLWYRVYGDEKFDIALFLYV